MTVRWRLAALVAIFFALGDALQADGVAVHLELDDGSHATGGLLKVADDSIELASGGPERTTFAVDRVREVVIAPATPDPRPGRVRLSLTDGTTLGGDDFSCTAQGAVLTTAAGRIELPTCRVRSLEWLTEGATGPPAWSDTVPEGTTEDLVVVGKADAYEFVECAIVEVGTESVVVVLDEERIPVKRSKVIGLRWQRPEAVGPGRTVVDVAGGRLRAETVAWTAEGLILDAETPESRVLLPAESLRRIDYASGRTTALATLAPEQLETEPFFGALATAAGLKDYFAPRPLSPEAPGSAGGLVIRPRTAAVWRIPAGGRRFRGAVAAGSEAGPAVVRIAVDGRTVLEHVVSGSEPIPIDIDLSGGRRLGVTVDFGPTGGMAGAVRILEPVIER